MPTEQEFAKTLARLYIKTVVAYYLEVEGTIALMKKLKRKALAKTKRIKKVRL